MSDVYMLKSVCATLRNTSFKLTLIDIVYALRVFMQFAVNFIMVLGVCVEALL